jgi:uncharacterized protein
VEANSSAGQRVDRDIVERTLRDAGVEARVLPVGRLSDLRRWFTDEVEGERLPASVRKDLHFALQESELPALPGGRVVRSLVVAARPRPFSRAVFTVGETHLTFTIPAIYSSHEGTAEELRRTLRRATDERCWFVPTRLPSKSLAVFSGLAAWGRNNVAYVSGHGSYVFLASFVSDWEPDADPWVGPTLLLRCEQCIACARACPTGAIDGDRLLLHIERCLTFMNEGAEPFPDWVDPSAHECPVGCAACQRACPENPGQEVLGPTAEFTAAETELLRRGAVAADLDDGLRERLQECGLLDYLPQLPRNLGVLLPRHGLHSSAASVRPADSAGDRVSRDRSDQAMERSLVPPTQAARERLRRDLGQSELVGECLERLAGLGLPNWYLGGGCLAQTVWNVAHGNPPATGIDDFDIAYFDADLSARAESEVIASVGELLADLPLRPDVKNQARVHLWYASRFGYEIRPYSSCEDALASWPTTAAAIGVRQVDGALLVEAPFGLDDLLELVVRPNRVQITPEIYATKVARWSAVWPRLRILSWDDGVGVPGLRRLGPPPALERQSG